MSITDKSDECNGKQYYEYTSEINEDMYEKNDVDPLYVFKNKYKAKDGTKFIVRNPNYLCRDNKCFVLLDSIVRENGLSFPKEQFNAHFTPVKSGGRKTTRKRKRRLFKNKNFRKTRKTRKTIKRH